MKQPNKINDTTLKQKFRDVVLHDLIRLNTCNTYVPYDQMSSKDVTFTSYGNNIYVTIFVKTLFIRVITYNITDDEIQWHVPKKLGIIDAIMASIDDVFNNTFSQIDLLSNSTVDQQTIDAIINEVYK